jgi:endonuclease/exonuclease/phosphatase family metal-dependent hydrolase
VDSGAVILTGDFNTKACTEIHRLFLSGPDGKGVRLIDAYSVLHPYSEGNERTWNGLLSGIFERRIDWILTTRHFKPVTVAIDKTNKSGLYPSDHFPVKAVLEIELGE